MQIYIAGPTTVDVTVLESNTKLSFPVCLSVCMLPTSTLKLHSTEGAAVSHDATVSF